MQPTAILYKLPAAARADRSQSPERGSEHFGGMEFQRHLLGQEYRLAVLRTEPAIEGETVKSVSHVFDVFHFLDDVNDSRFRDRNRQGRHSHAILPSKSFYRSLDQLCQNEPLRSIRILGKKLAGFRVYMPRLNDENPSPFHLLTTMSAGAAG